MLIRELIARNKDTTNLIAPDLLCLSGFSVDVLQSDALQREIMSRYQGNEDADKRLQFIAFSYISKMHCSPQQQLVVREEASPKGGGWRFALVLKVVGVVLTFARTLMRGRSAKLQQVLMRYAMMLYYAVFRVSSLVRM